MADLLVLILWFVFGAGCGGLGYWALQPYNRAFLMSRIKKKPYALYKIANPAGRRYAEVIQEDTGVLKVSEKEQYTTTPEDSIQKLAVISVPEYFIDRTLGTSRDILSPIQSTEKVIASLTVPMKCPACGVTSEVTGSKELEIPRNADAPTPMTIANFLRSFAEDGLAIGRMVGEGAEEALKKMPQQLWWVCGIIVCIVIISTVVTKGSADGCTNAVMELSKNVTEITKLKVG